MKTIFIKAKPYAKNAFFRPYKYYPFRHPVEEWINIFKADTLGKAFDKEIDWDNYNLAFSFCHNGGIGGTTHLRKIAPHLKIVTILEPTPNFYRRRFWRGPLFHQFKEDIINSDIALIQECYQDSFRQFFGVNNIHGMNMPINIPEYLPFINLDERKPIIAMTGHCNLSESAWRGNKIIQEAKKLLRRPFKTRLFYAVEKELQRAGFNIDEACPFIWDYKAHLKRLNQCYIMVDDSAGFTGHMCLEMACLGIPSVGSNDFINQLCPELGYPPRILVEDMYREPIEVKILAQYIARLASEKSFYKEMTEKIRIRLNAKYSHKECKKKLLRLLR